jgi:hypothetical protein
MTLIGWFGYSCAHAGVRHAQQAIKDAIATAKARLFLTGFLQVSSFCGWECARVLQAHSINIVPTWKDARPICRSMAAEDSRLSCLVLSGSARLGRSELREHNAEELGWLQCLHRDGTFVLQEFERGALAILFAVYGHRAFAQEEQLDRRLHSCGKGRARI